mmetsp:Transcript_46690/g.68577  ORF Transcript_46690/g.68577 Transcript_46690/m.68577 type:complete len:430 (-) Transcript_46690:463-1752(-)
MHRDWSPRGVVSVFKVLAHNGGSARHGRRGNRRPAHTHQRVVLIKHLLAVPVQIAVPHLACATPRAGPCAISAHQIGPWRHQVRFDAHGTLHRIQSRVFALKYRVILHGPLRREASDFVDVKVGAVQRIGSACDRGVGGFAAYCLLRPERRPVVGVNFVGLRLRVEVAARGREGAGVEASLLLGDEAQRLVDNGLRLPAVALRLQLAVAEVDEALYLRVVLRVVVAAVNRHRILVLHIPKVVKRNATSCRRCLRHGAVPCVTCCVVGSHSLLFAPERLLADDVARAQGTVCAERRAHLVHGIHVRDCLQDGAVVTVTTAHGDAVFASAGRADRLLRHIIRQGICVARRCQQQHFRSVKDKGVHVCCGGGISVAVLALGRHAPQLIAHDLREVARPRVGHDAHTTIVARLQHASVKVYRHCYIVGTARSC